MYDNYFSLRDNKIGNFSLQSHVFDILPNDKNSKILDIGCGLCKHLSQLKKIGYNNLKGVDISTEAEKACKFFDIDFELINNIEEFVSSENEKYDFIILAHVLEHIAKEKVIDTLTSIRALLKPEGKLYIVVPNAQSNTGSYWAYEDFTHYTLYTSGSLMFVLKLAGFTKLEFVDVHSLSGLSFVKKTLKRIFLKIYVLNYNFWNKVTNSQFQVGSPLIFSFELKIIAS